MSWEYLFAIDDLEKGFLYYNFIVKDKIPKIITRVGTAKDGLETDLVDSGKFREVTEEVFQTLVKKGKVILIGDRGIGKSTLATYVSWRLLRDKLADVVIRVNKLIPGDALMIRNQIKTTNKRFIIIYDPSPIEAYYEPETAQNIEYDIEGMKTTIEELVYIRDAWVIAVLPNDFYNIISESKELREVLGDIKNYMISVNLKDKTFLREVIKEYSGCDRVSDELVKEVMNYDSYTLVAKYVGIIMRERGCDVGNVDDIVRESVNTVKLFFAYYIWGAVFKEDIDLAMKASVPLVLYMVFGKLPEELTYMVKAVNDGGVWRLIDRDRIVKTEREDLSEDDLEPIAKWLSIWHEDLIDETLKDLVGLNGEDARNRYRNYGFRDFIESLDWGYEKIIERIVSSYRNLNR